MRTQSPLVSALLLGCLLLAAGCSKEAKLNRHLLRADEFFQSDQLEKARIEYLNVLQVDSGHAPAITRLGEIYFRQGDYSAAVPFLLKSKEIDPSAIENRVKLGQIFLAAQQYENAGNEARFVLDTDPAHPEALLLLSSAVSTPQEIQEAQDRLAKARDQAGKSASYQLALFNLHLKERNTAAAEAALKAAELSEPGSWQVHLAKGRYYFFQNQREEAEQGFRRAAELAPPRSGASLRWAEFKAKTGSIDEGRRIANEFAAKVPDYAPAWAFLAQLAFAEKKVDEALDFAGKAEKLDPRNFDALLVGAQASLAKQDGEGAARKTAALRTSFPGAPAVHYYSALAFVLNKDMPEAIRSLERAVTLNPDYSEAVLLLAQMNIRKGDIKSAIVSLKEFTGRFPKHKPAALLLATAYAAQGSWESAVTAYRELKQTYPTDPQIPHLLGLTFVQSNQPDAARKEFEEVLQLSPGNALTMSLLTELDLAEKDYVSAGTRIDQLVEKQPNAAAPFFLRAKLRVAQGNAAGAEADLQKAIELEPASRSAHFALAQLYIESKRHQEAITKLDEIVQRNPRDAGALFQKGLIFELLNDFPKARAAYENVLQINPGFAPVLNNLAYLYSEKFNDVDRAYQLAQKARDNQPGDPAILDTLGWVLVRRKEFDRALPLLQESASKMPGQAEVQYHLGSAFYMNGLEQPARDTLNKALALSTNFPGKSDADARLRVLGINSTTGTDEEMNWLKSRVTEEKQDLMAWIRLAELQRVRGQAEAAAQSLEEALQINPRLVRVILDLARSYSADEAKRHRALELAKSARAVDPEDPHIAHLLGRLASESGDSNWGLSLLQESVRKQGENPEVLFDLAWALYLGGRVDDARGTMERALKGELQSSRASEARTFLRLTERTRDADAARALAQPAREALRGRPDYLPALMATARVEAEDGDPRKAAATYETILARHKSFAPAARQLAILYAERLMDDEKALQWGTSARETLRNDAELAKTLGAIHCRRKDYRAALPHLEEAARRLPGDAEVFYFLGLAQYGMKDLSNSKKSLNQSLAFNLSADKAQEAKRILGELK